ncbi:MAG: hypothetical protein ABIP75_14535 [Pyrinomonadaceae bacterium]
MNSFSKRGISARTFTLGVGLAVILMFAAISPAFGQRGSEDRDDPLALKSDTLPLKVTDALDGTATELFYSFPARAGKWTLTFDVKAAGTNSGAYFDVFGPNSKALLSNALVQGIDSGSDRVVKTLQISKQQTILIRVTGIRYGDSGGEGTFAFTLAPPPKPVAKGKAGKAAQ